MSAMEKMIEKMLANSNGKIDIMEMAQKLHRLMKDELMYDIYKRIITLAESFFEKKKNDKPTFDRFIEALKLFGEDQKKRGGNLATDAVTIPNFDLDSLHAATKEIKFNHSVLMAERLWKRGYITKDALKDIFAVNEVGKREFSHIMKNYEED